VLAVVDQQERIEIDLGGFDPIGSHAKRPGNLRLDPVNTHGCELHKPYAVSLATESAVTEFESDPRLAGPAYAVHGYQARPVEQTIELLQPTDKGGAGRAACSFRRASARGSRQ